MMSLDESVIVTCGGTIQDGTVGVVGVGEASFTSGGLFAVVDGLGRGHRSRICGSPRHGPMRVQASMNRSMALAMSSILLFNFLNSAAG